MDMYNVAIIGAGPAGIFSALEIVKLRPEWKVILIEKGQKIEKRKCPIREGSPKCVNCKRCGLLCGWGGAGAFSDGKLTLTPEVGGHLVDYMPWKKVEEYIKYAVSFRDSSKKSAHYAKKSLLSVIGSIYSPFLYTLILPDAISSMSITFPSAS